ncbi:glutathione S-transferase N-terminal domain-containing protein [Patescibacteria group bacterium]|nr:glutathione S-transferase N-terminal domain-containing protein [Patescibacteria group bacterium]MBU2219952.1 glutathione S-transferase N-terminal domain-containing protein [Patescibacteria group bacterium]MBU2264643.1 glutathione S-transferase N-terminal domain-containing protein [Patescibacteria group bacterium]
MIKVYSTPACAYCVTLKKFLDEKGIKYESIDVSQSAKDLQEMIDKSGQMGVPVVEIDGQIIVGFNKNKIVELLNIKD